jgi:ABC-2 type transport system permease protein
MGATTLGSIKEFWMKNQRGLPKNLRIIWAIAAKDMGDAIRNKTAISIIIGVAVLMLSGQAMPLLLKLQAVPRAYYYDAGESSLIPDLAKSKDYQLVKMPSQDELENIVAESSGAVLGLVIPPDFDQKVEGGEIVKLEGLFVHWIKSKDVEEVVSFFEQELSGRLGVSLEISVQGNAVYPGPDTDGQPFMLTLSLVVATITIGSFLIPLLMVEEREKHTMEAMMVSPASYSQIVLGKTIAGLFYCITAAAVVLVINFSMINQWGIAVLAVLGGALFTVAIGLLVGTLFDHQGVMNMWLGLILILLIMPVFLEQTIGGRLPEAIAAIFPWLPSVAMAKLVRISLANSLVLDQVALNLGIMLGFTALMLGAVVWRIRGMDR